MDVKTNDTSYLMHNSTGYEEHHVQDIVKTILLDMVCKGLPLITCENIYVFFLEMHVSNDQLIAVIA